jgi:hypothetical protein
VGPADHHLCFRPAGAKVDERDSRPWGVVKEDGSYTLATYDGGAGAPAGECMFTITWPSSVKLPRWRTGWAASISKPEQSRRKMTIKPGENALPDVETTDVVVNSKLQQESKPIGPMNLERRRRDRFEGADAAVESPAPDDVGLARRLAARSNR